MAKEREKISKFSGEISSLQARLEASLWEIDESYFNFASLVTASRTELKE